MTIVVPHRIDAEVRRICAAISQRAPRFVDLRPDPDAKPNDCFITVERQIGREGGECVHGWLVAIWPGVFAEGIHHAVWRSPSGDLVDVSPAPMKTSRVLFIEDPEADYDAAGYDARPSRRVALRDHPLVHEYLAASAEKDRIARSTPGPVVRMTAALEEALGRRTRAHRALLHAFLGPNDQCPCVSGKKFKKCCRTIAGFEARLLRLSTGR